MNAVSTAVLEPLDSKVERFATMMLVVGGLGLLAALGSAVLWPIFRMEQPVVASVALLAAFFFADLTHGWVLAYVVLLRKSFDAPRLGGAVAGPAVSAVLAAFMTGLALGAHLGGRWSRKVTRPLFAYGILELVVALTVALGPTAFAAEKVSMARSYCFRRM